MRIKNLVLLLNLLWISLLHANAASMNEVAEQIDKKQQQQIIREQQRQQQFRQQMQPDVNVHLQPAEENLSGTGKLITD